MQHHKVNIGEKSFKMPVISFGAGSFERFSEREHYFRMLDIYFDSGGTLVDTARCYNIWLPGGADVSETVLGYYFSERGGRNKILLATKGGFHTYGSEPPRINEKEVTADLDTSLKILNTDYTDIYFLHRDDETREVSEIMPFLNRFIIAGKVRFLGASNWNSQRIREANRFAMQNGLTPFSFSQIQFSLAQTTSELLNDPGLVCMNTNEREFYEEEEISLMAFSSQAKGFFSKNIFKGELNKKIEDRYYSEENIKRRTRAIKVAEKRGISPAAVALSYVFSGKIRVSAIVGCKTESQLQDSLSAINVKLSSEEINFLENGK